MYSIIIIKYQSFTEYHTMLLVYFGYQITYMLLILHVPVIFLVLRRMLKSILLVLFVILQKKKKTFLVSNTSVVHSFLANQITVGFVRY